MVIPSVWALSPRNSLSRAKLAQGGHDRESGGDRARAPLRSAPHMAYHARGGRGMAQRDPRRRERNRVRAPFRPRRGVEETVDRPAASEWASYREPAGDGPAFCGHLTTVPPPWPGSWQRVTGGWLREPAPQPAAPTPEPTGPRAQGAGTTATDAGPKAATSAASAARRAKRREYDRRRSATPERRRYMAQYMRSGYLRRWREEHPRRLDPFRIGLRWARPKGTDGEFHLVGVIGDRRRRPDVAYHCVCRPFVRVPQWSCPPPGGAVPDARKCVICAAVRPEWLRRVAAPR